MMKLSKDQLNKLLAIRNLAIEIIDELRETGDIGVGKLSELERKLKYSRIDMDDILNFKPQKDEQGDPNRWLPYVLGTSSNAWHYRPENDNE